METAFFQYVDSKLAGLPPSARKGKEHREVYRRVSYRPGSYHVHICLLLTSRIPETIILSQDLLLP